jgi:hypothetical protein
MPLVLRVVLCDEESGSPWGDRLMIKTTRAILLPLAICVVTAAQVRADFIPIAQPDAAYLAATTLIPITDDDGVPVTSLTDGFQTITIDSTPIAATVPTTWDTWSSPPDSETATPRVLNTGFGIGFLTLNLDVPSRIFGVEIQGNDQEVVPEIYATFYRNGTEVGTIGIPVNGFEGARLFAASTTTSPFDSVSVAIDFQVDGSGFAMAQFRYGDPVPEPSTLVFGSLGVIGICGSIRRRRDKTFVTVG